MSQYIPILSTVVAFAFAASIFNRYRQKKGSHLLLWGAGMSLYGAGTLMEALMAFTFSPLLLKVWYISGAMLTAAWLGQGTVHLLVRKRGVAPLLTDLLIAASLLSLALVQVSPVAAGSFDTNLPASIQYKEILPRSGMIILLTVLLNLYGTAALVGGAIYSAYLFWRKKVLFNRLAGNLLIAAGALLPAAAGSMLQSGVADWLYVSEFFGAILMYVGFLRATSSAAAEAPLPAGAPSM
ncbi:MAG: hypothetical protein L0Z70_09805 [Chloroflexi bacterium]|nr:hypothetical protein [Chloroflexota bacterium]